MTNNTNERDLSNVSMDFRCKDVRTGSQNRSNPMQGAEYPVSQWPRNQTEDRLREQFPLVQQTEAAAIAWATKIGNALLQLGLITLQQLQDARKISYLTGYSLQETLVAMEFVTRQQLAALENLMLNAMAEKR